VKKLILILLLITTPTFAMIFGAPIFIGYGLNAFGDSFTIGSGASDTAHQYAIRLNGFIGGAINNKAVSGTGTTIAAQNACTYLPNNRKSAVSILAGYNDLGHFGANAYTEIKSNLRSLIACSLLSESIPASAMRSNGVWNALGSNFGGRAFASGGTPLYTDDALAWLEWDFYGETLVVGAFSTCAYGAEGPAYHNVKVIIDGGVSQLLQTLNIQCNELYAYTSLILKNLGFSKHTVRLSVDDPSYHTTVDYVGTLIEPKIAQAVLVGEIPTRILWSSGLATQAMTDLVNIYIADTVAEFAEWPVKVVPISQFYFTSDVGPDGLHPNDNGHLHIYQAFKSQISLHN